MKRREREHHFFPPSEGTEEAPSMSQEESLHQELNLLAP